MTKLDSILKSRDITLPTKVHLVKAMIFSVGKALQKMLGVKQDGYVGAITVKALQRALNAGKLK